MVGWLTGAALRLWNLGAQVLDGDELHAVRAALQWPLSGILFRYLPTDNCIPMTALDRLAIDSGWRLTEWMVRLPVALAGLATLVGAALWVRRRMGVGPAVLLAWLAAISPGLVFYARFARSYAPATFFGCAAVAVFDAWLRRGGWALGAAYALAATLAVWFHLGAAPLALSPFLMAAAEVAWNRGRGLRRVLLLGLATAACLVALLAPAHRTLLPLIAMRHGKLDLTGAEAMEVASWEAGARAAWIGLLFWALVIVGLVRLFRRDRGLGGLLAAAIGGHLAGILWLAPQFHQISIILSRYLVFALPCALAAAAAALGLGWAGRWQALQPLASGLCLLALFVAGPFTNAALARSSFTNEEIYLRFTTPVPELEAPHGALKVYRWLESKSPGAVVEAPWDSLYLGGRALALYQQVHRRPVVVAVAPFEIGAAGPLDARLSFRNAVDMTPEALIASRGKWLIIHRSILNEELRIGAIQSTPGLRSWLAGTAADLQRRLRAQWGPPDYSDRWVEAWGLDRPRRRTQAAARAPGEREGLAASFAQGHLQHLR